MDYSINRHKNGDVTFSPSKINARVMMVPFATDAALMEQVLKLGENQHQTWGVKELLESNIEVTVVHLTNSRWERLGQDWRLPDTREYDLIYSNHNLLVRTPLQSLMGLQTTPFASLVYAGELLLSPHRHFGVLCMTPFAYSRFESLNQRGVRVRYAPWGLDPASALHQPLQPGTDHFISTGVTGRDFATLFQSAQQVDDSIVISARGQTWSDVPANVQVIDKFVGPWEIRDLYKGAYAGLVILQRDERKRVAVGWTNMLELMAIGLPVIKTRTGSLDDIVNVESIGAGILVEPEDPQALAAAMQRLKADPELRLSMGRAGAEYVRQHLTMRQFAEPLIEMVEAVRKQR